MDKVSSRVDAQWPSKTDKVNYNVASLLKNKPFSYWMNINNYNSGILRDKTMDNNLGTPQKDKTYIWRKLENQIWYII